MTRSFQQFVQPILPVQVKSNSRKYFIVTSKIARRNTAFCQETLGDRTSTNRIFQRITPFPTRTHNPNSFRLFI